MMKPTAVHRPANETAPHRAAHQAQIVPNGREAVETLTNQTYAAVLMDWRMPEMDGFETTRTIRPLVSRLKVISELDTVERRLPQDGRIVFKDFPKKGLDFDLRLQSRP